jgi:1,4-alpha-glucan branching enzyme
MNIFPNCRRLLLLIGLLISVVRAQLITSDPPYSTVNDSIIIFFDATKAERQDLVGYTGDLYTHTGVNSSKGNWQHVIGSWGKNDIQPKLTRISSDYYKLTIGHPREFYSITSPSEKIFSLCFVFRSADATKQTEDIFYDLFEPGLTVFFTQPQVDLSFGDPRRSPVFVGPTDSLRIIGKAAAIGTVLDSLILLADGQVVAAVADTEISYLWQANNFTSGTRLVSLVGSDTVGMRDTTALVIMINPPLRDVDLPPGIQDGINIITDDEVILALFAPYKDFVYVIGDFNDWLVDSSYFMNRYYVTEDSVMYWLQIDGLDPSSEYAFQYLIDGELRIADPYTHKILDPANDPYITADIYPDLKAYPVGKTAEIVGTFQTDIPQYVCQAENYTRPDKKNLVIYELLIRDFIARHDYRTLNDTLNYLANLGINAIELMPVSEFEGNSSWGYNPSFHLALDKYYGTPDDFKRFVDECHARGIAVIIDMVLNHVYGQSPLVRMYWNSAEGRPAANSPWFNEVSPNPVYAWGYDFNHESKDTKAYVDRVNAYWLNEYHIDGFRFDFTKGFTNTPGDGSGYDASRISILERMANEIRKVDKDAYIILEHFANNEEEKYLADYELLLWGNANWNYGQSAMGYTDQSDFSWGFYKNRSWTKPGLITYMESHDEERLMYKNLTWGNAAGSYDIQEVNTALNRMKLVNAFFLTLPGPKMIWQFGELGYDISIDNPCRVCEKPILWNYNQDLSRRNLYKTIAALLKLRRESDVFTSSQTNVHMSVNSDGKRIILTGSPNVVIIGNFGVTEFPAWWLLV